MPFKSWILRRSPVPRTESVAVHDHPQQQQQTSTVKGNSYHAHRCPLHDRPHASGSAGGSGRSHLEDLLTFASRTGLAFSGSSISQPVSVVPSSVALATRCGAAHIS